MISCRLQPPEMARRFSVQRSDRAALGFANFVWQSPNWLVAAGLAAILLFLGGCASSRGGNIPYAVEGFSEPDAPSMTTLDPSYRIGPLDKLSINVFLVGDLSGEYVVDLTGNIAMPLLGNVRAVDKTPAELQEQLTESLSAKYLKNPQVSVGVLEATGSMLTVEGSVKKPGMYPAYGKTSLIQAIAVSGGLDDTANPKRVAVFRQIGGQRVAAAFDLTTIRSGEEEDPQVYRGDIIVVDGSKTKQAWRNIIYSVPFFGLFRPLGY